MAYGIQFVGIILILTAGTTPGILKFTALAPRATVGSYCDKKQTVEPHKAYIRVINDQIVEAGTDWPGRRACDGNIKPACTLFEIPSQSELAIDAHFTPEGATHLGNTFCQVPILADKQPRIRLIDDPRSKAEFAMDLPAGAIEANKFANGSVASYLWVTPPQGTTITEPITITTTPFGSAAPARTLKVQQGTLINVMYVPEHHAGGDFENDKHPIDKSKRHFYLVNEVLPDDSQICTPPPKARPLIFDPSTGKAHCGSADTDPFCSNTGCC